jgi:hypothetical protein
MFVSPAAAEAQVSSHWRLGRPEHCIAIHNTAQHGPVLHTGLSSAAAVVGGLQNPCEPICFIKTGVMSFQQLHCTAPGSCSWEAVSHAEEGGTLCWGM